MRKYLLALLCLLAAGCNLNPPAFKGTWTGYDARGYPVTYVLTDTTITVENWATSRRGHLSATDYSLRWWFDEIKDSPAAPWRATAASDSYSALWSIMDSQLLLMFSNGTLRLDPG